MKRIKEVSGETYSIRGQKEKGTTVHDRGGNGLGLYECLECHA
jgi:hypothetical protein